MVLMDIRDKELAKVSTRQQQVSLSAKPAWPEAAVQPCLGSLPRQLLQHSCLVWFAACVFGGLYMAAARLVCQRRGCIGVHTGQPCEGGQTMCLYVYTVGLPAKCRTQGSMCVYAQEKLPWSEEVLVSKAELEERRSHVADLEQQVAELTMQTEYQSGSRTCTCRCVPGAKRTAAITSGDKYTGSRVLDGLR